MRVLSNNNKVLLSQPRFSMKAFQGFLDQLADRTEPGVGILHCGRDAAGLLLFVLQGDWYAAGRYQGKKMEALTPEQFRTEAEKSEANAVFYATNPIFFKMLLSVCRCQPKVVGDGQVINLETLLETVKKKKEEQMLTLRRGEEFNLFYFRGGKLIEGFFAEPSRVSGDMGNLLEALLLYSYEPGETLEISLYERLEVDHPSSAISPVRSSGATAAILEYQVGTRRLEKKIDKGVFLIGRGGQVDCPIDDSSVSREHARIVRDEEGFQIEDLKSLNGTYVNGQRIVKERLPGDCLLQIGLVEVRFSEQMLSSPPKPSDGAPVPAARPAGPPEGWCMEVVEGREKGTVYPLMTGKKMGLGRGNVEISINDTKVSRHHADVEWENGAFVLKDLQSTNGSYVNDRRVTQQRLTAGDLVRVGETVLRVTSRP